METKHSEHWKLSLPLNYPTTLNKMVTLLISNISLIQIMIRNQKDHQMHTLASRPSKVHVIESNVKDSGTWLYIPAT